MHTSVYIMNEGGLFINKQPIIFSIDNICDAIELYDFDIHSIDNLSCIWAADIVKCVISKQLFAIVVDSIANGTNNSRHMSQQRSDHKLITVNNALLGVLKMYPNHTVVIL
jgi:hypothetical protein